MGFKEGFFWGGATAANQYEGGYLSGGKGLAIQDVITGGDGRNNIPMSENLSLSIPRYISISEYFLFMTDTSFIYFSVSALLIQYDSSKGVCECPEKPMLSIPFDTA